MNRWKKNPRFSSRKNPRGKNLSKTFFRLAALAFLGTVIYVLFFSPYLFASRIEVDGEKLVDEKEIALEVQKIFSGKYGNLIPRNNLLLMREELIRRAVLEKWKIIREVQVEKEFPDSLFIKIEERIPAAIIFSGEDGFWLDQNGEAYDQLRLFDLAGEAEGYLSIRDESAKEVKINGRPVSPEYLKKAEAIFRGIEEQIEIEVENYFRTPSLISDDLRLRTQEGWETYFNPSLPADRTLEILRLTLEEKIPREKRKELEYIDLRIKDKVYFKLKNSDLSDASKKEE